MSGNFSDALDRLINATLGARLRRYSWKDTGKYIFHVPGSVFQVNRPPLLGIYPEGTTVTYAPHIDILNADGRVSPYVPSQEDMFADDWEILS